MTPSEAMTDLSIQREVKRRLGKTREAESIGLGIEALKWYKDGKKIGWVRTDYFLPGETEDSNPR